MVSLKKKEESNACMDRLVETNMHKKSVERQHPGRP